MSQRKRAPNPNGRNGDKLRIPLPFEDALKAAVETKPPESKKRPRAKRG
jgi:hypothetical protein